MSEEVSFWFSLCRHSKQGGDESHLPKDISFVHSLHLSFPDHVRDLIALQGSPRRLQGKEAHPWLDQPFDQTMVLLDQVVSAFIKPDVINERQSYLLARQRRAQASSAAASYARRPRP